jgi:hypothetical protein
VRPGQGRWERSLRTGAHDLGAKASRSRDRAFYDAVLKHFGSWRKALAASGVNMANVSLRRPKHLDREVMILWLQQRHAAGQSLGWAVVCLENRGYALAIRRTFGSWRKALDAAGVSAAS